jgi:hypothetical protein
LTGKITSPFPHFFIALPPHSLFLDLANSLLSDYLKMKSVLLAVVLSYLYSYYGVDAFSCTPPLTKAITSWRESTLSESTTDDDVEPDQFWGRPRNKEEIVDFVSNAVFTDQNNDDQWVEVISAEPPVSESDLFRFCDLPLLPEISLATKLISCWLFMDSSKEVIATKLLMQHSNHRMVVPQ